MYVYILCTYIVLNKNVLCILYHMNEHIQKIDLIKRININNIQPIGADPDFYFNLKT